MRIIEPVHVVNFILRNQPVVPSGFFGCMPEIGMNGCSAFDFWCVRLNLIALILSGKFVFVKLM